MDFKKRQAVVLVDPVSSGRFLKRYVATRGFKIIGVFTLTGEQLRRAGKFIPYPERAEFCDLVLHQKNVDHIMRELATIPYEIVAVVAASEPGVEIADKLAARLNLKGNRHSSSSARRDKYQTRCAVRQAGLNGPAFSACRTVREAISFSKINGLPVVVKTPKGAGAHLVFVCHNLDDVATAFDRVIREPDIFGTTTSFALLEGYVSGPQYAVELFGHGTDIAMTSLWRLDFQKNNETTAFDRMRTVIETNELRKLNHIVQYAIAAAHAVDIQWGPCLVEVRDDPVHGPLLIEIAARLSGIDMPWLIKKTTTFDPFDATLETYLCNGHYAMEKVRSLKYAGIVFCSSPNQGRVERIHGIEEIRKLPSYMKSSLSVSPGDIVYSGTDLSLIPCYIYLAHQNQQQLENDMETAKTLFRMDVIDLKDDPEQNECSSTAIVSRPG